MATEAIRIGIPGTPGQITTDPALGRLLKVTTIGSYRIQQSARGVAMPEESIEVPADALVQVDYASGITEWLRADQIGVEFGQTRGTDQVYIPTIAQRGVGLSRGPTDWVLKALHFFSISPADAMAKETADAIINHFDSALKTGLYRLQPDGSFGPLIDESLPDDEQPYLVFIHGTASSTQGSFGGFWLDQQTTRATPEWTSFVKTYGKRILALEHRTFSVSPAQNALDLLALLPKKATIHLITHSRGGLVGELLGLGSLSSDDLEPFRGRPDFTLLETLSAKLQDKQLQVTKFVRTACPAAGTILASGRLDLYLNIILNVLNLMPALSASPTYALFKATALELIKLRASPAEIPGIEAQMPESPLIHLLNTRGRYSKADLGVIAGNFEGSGVWGTLKSYALRAYYYEDNDFVVNTKSMSGGMERQNGVWQFLDQGSTVNHFSYFKNSRTRSHILSWLSAPPTQAAQDFERVRSVVEGARTRGVEELPIAFLVPDVFGTQLGSANDTIWFNFDALAKGQFLQLANDNVQISQVHELYQRLYETLKLSHDAALFPYDWRKPIFESAQLLKKAVTAKLNGSHRSVRFVAHGMGGLVIREFARQNADCWKELCGEDSAVLMLGAPNSGSWHIAKVVAGRSRLSRMLALLGRHADADVMRVLQSFRGLLDMLPREMFDPKRWDALPVGRPAPALLEQSANWRVDLDKFSALPYRVFNVYGNAPATPSGMDDYTPEGDGQVTYALGSLPGVRTLFHSGASHGDLAYQPERLMQVLATGITAVLDKVPPTLASALNKDRLLNREIAVFFPSESDLLAAAFGSSEPRQAEAETVVNVKVVHGHLREANYPLAVGHYIGDSIVSAEAELDRQLNYRLSTRFHMELYPGPTGTADVVRTNAAHPPGALVVGLGEVGEITPDRVRRGVLEACLRYALARSEDPKPGDGQPQSASFSSLLIGVSGGRAISIGDSVTSIVRAALEANRLLKRRKLWDQVRIEEIEFIELYEEAAIEAAHAAAAIQENLRAELEPGERIAFDGRLRSAAGGLVRRPLSDYASGWWRRVQIAVDRCAQADTPSSTSATALVFESLTDKARAEQILAASQTSLVESLLSEATGTPSYDDGNAVALFELLFPNALKDQATENPDLVLVLDPVSAHYPWELMAQRKRKGAVPLSVQMGMIRQLKVDVFRAGPRQAREYNALVVGDTKSPLPELPGAQDEARAVSALLTSYGYAATPPLIREEPLAIIRQLFARDYRILHLAGHGTYNASKPAKSGMVLSSGVFLSPLELCQVRNLPELVFINCCHLGAIDQRLGFSAPHRMAASVAQTLIEMGVKAVIAAGWAVDDTGAVIFAKAFYNAMLSGCKFGESVKRARQAAYAVSGSNTWGAYQCYGNPDFALVLQEESQSSTPRVFYSKREYVEELNDITASAKGSSTESAAKLQARAAELDNRIPSVWRDAEVLFALAEAHKATNNLTAAIESYRHALAQERCAAPVRAIEQLSNTLDSQAYAIYAGDPAQAEKLWDEAASKLTDLNELLGESSERLSLLGALWKRRGLSDTEKRTAFFQKASKFYKRAYDHTRTTEARINLYPGLNWLALEYLVEFSEHPQDPEKRNGRLAEFKALLQECIEEAKRHRDDPSIWDRIYVPDALLLESLINGDPDGAVNSIIETYRVALQHAAPNERNSALRQIKFLHEMLPESNGLKRIYEEVSQSDGNVR